MAIDYITPAEARNRNGLRLVLTGGVPGPWGEAAKSVFYARNVSYQAVLQIPGETDEDLEAWTGASNAPAAVYNDEAPCSRWEQILYLAERLGSGPSLVPDEVDLRVEMHGLAQEICGEQGFGWSCRLAMLEPVMQGDTSDPAVASTAVLARKYGYREDAVGQAGPRVKGIMQMLARRLARQKAAGSDYLVGNALTAADIYWATFAALVKPLPDDFCPMPANLRAMYTNNPPPIADAVDALPELFVHRDLIYEKYLTLPMEF
jgi:glutathione S-transferase